MCGRARFRCAAEPMATACKHSYNLNVDLDNISNEEYKPKENGSPGSVIGVLHAKKHAGGSGPDAEAEVPLHDSIALVLKGMCWGLVPSFTKAGTKPDFYKMFNARSETIFEKPVFSRLLKSRRCIICVDGFYEWKCEHKVKQPYYIYMKGSRPLLFAGLYDTWRDGEGSETMYTCTILTTSAAPRFMTLHNRMPVILNSAESCNAWLTSRVDDQTGKERLLRNLCVPYDGEDLKWHPVTTSLNRPNYQEDDCSKELKKNTITSFFIPQKRKFESGIKAEPAD